MFKLLINLNIFKVEIHFANNKNLDIVPVNLKKITQKLRFRK